jgi:hypothetical protein
LEEGFNGFGPTYVALEGVDAGQLLPDQVQFGLIPACYDDRIAEAHELSGQFETDSAGAAGNEDGIVF